MNSMSASCVLGMAKVDERIGIDQKTYSLFQLFEWI
ncbi:hypothetical protein EVA_15268 [gut metagenome]|uniref:Uncharacterized protein n=1 Tax=gut metagenome TaxID=749906 RepID=J9C9R2_9ZZZZ